MYGLVGWSVPNYSGLFLRGHGGQTSYHYNAIWHGSGNLGAVQGDAIRNIWGSVTASEYHNAAYEFLGDTGATGYGAFYTTDYRYQNGVGSVAPLSGNRPQTFVFDAARAVPTAGENRPVNTAVRYLIRARQYPDLVAIIGLNTPNYSGLFLRGHGGNSFALGVMQGDAIRNISGSVSAATHSDGNDEFFGDGGAVGYGSFYTTNYAHQSGTGNVGPRSYARAQAFIFDAARVVPTAVENRPVNTAVRYLIRAQ